MIIKTLNTFIEIAKQKSKKKMVVAAAEVAVGLAILVMMKRNIDSVDINLLSRLKW